MSLSQTDASLSIKPSISLVLLATIQCGCATHQPFRPNADLQLVAPTEQPKENDSGQPYAFKFGGIYHISKVNRTDKADSFAPRIARDDEKYEDGAIVVCIHPAPFGVKLRLTNKISAPITLIGNRCSMVDVNGRTWSAELRDTTARFPTLEPTSQELTIPENATCEIDLDVILP